MQRQHRAPHNIRGRGIEAALQSSSRIDFGGKPYDYIPILCNFHVRTFCFLQDKRSYEADSVVAALTQEGIGVSAQTELHRIGVELGTHKSYKKKKSVTYADTALAAGALSAPIAGSKKGKGKAASAQEAAVSSMPEETSGTTVDDDETDVLTAEMVCSFGSVAS